MAFEYTDEQLSAIRHRERTVLVSAAAGSGKTRTLTRRIIVSILEENTRFLHDVEEKKAKSRLSEAEIAASLLSEGNYLSIADMLIVTFTNAAIAELHERIDAALKKEIEENGDSPYLMRELYLLPGAHICTIDAFCNEIVRNNAQKLGFDPNFRIADTAESALLESMIMDAMIGEAYEGRLSVNPDDFAALTACFANVRNESRVTETLLAFYNQTASVPKGIEGLKPLIEIYNPKNFSSPEETVFAKRIVREGNRLLQAMADALSYQLRLLPRETPYEKKYFAFIENAVSLLRDSLPAASLQALITKWNDLNFGTKPSIGKEKKTEEEIETEAIRDAFTKNIKAFSDRFLFLNNEEWKELFTKTYKYQSILLDFLTEYERNLFEEKRRRNLLTFNDIERLCYASLYEQDGTRTDCAKALADRFCAVYIDEYQDVNRLQHLIFEAVSRPNNRFMVGDIKQSIYRFRGAEPDVFTELKRDLPDLASAKDNAPAKIFLTENFRCDRSVVAFINSIFDCVFSYIGESIHYEDADKLVFGKKFDGAEPPYLPAEIHCLTLPEGTKLSSEERQRAEARSVSRKIHELLDSGVKDDGTKYTFGDIAVLFRSRKNKAALYADEFRKSGLPVSVSEDKAFFLSPEILLTLALLNTVDNPLRDIYLAGVMMSPLFKFTADELLILSRKCKGTTLWEKLHDEKALPAEKIQAMESTLGRFRKYAEGCPISNLLSKIYSETGLLAIAAENGGKDNLMLLYEHARSFESGDLSGLHSFIAYLNNLIASSNSFKIPESSNANDCIRIMSIHSSKGLEFPACFLVCAGSGLDGKDNTNVLFSNEFGISFKLRDSTGLGLVNAPTYQTILDDAKEKRFDEECRILYVALTRAQERLFVYGSTLHTAEKHRQMIAKNQALMSSYTVRGFKSFLEIVASTAKDCPPIYEEISEDAAKADVADRAAKESADVPTPPDLEEAEAIKKMLEFRLGDEEVSDLPEKLSVSRLSPSLLDDASNAASLPSPDPDGNAPNAESGRPIEPMFITNKRPDESALRGIATHRFLQFCDFKKLSEGGVDDEIKRLLNEKFLSKFDADLVRKEEIEKFLASSLYARISAAKKLYREFRFNVNLPAELFATDPEKKKKLLGKTILVQGVIDCLIENPDGSLSLIDYKTDRLSPKEQASRALAEKKLYDAHSVQLAFYSEAVERIFKKLPETVEVYSLALGDTVSVKKTE